MKKILLSAAFMAAMTTAFAQTEILNLQLKSGETVLYPISDIEKITFTEAQAENGAYSFKVPESFTSSYVQKVMVDGKQVAEIDLEYIKSIDKQVTVIYPCGEDGRADLTKGLTTTGAAVVWDIDKNTATVGEEGEAISTFFIKDGVIYTSFDGETSSASVVADLLTDRRGTETNTYKIVKIGTQYWMAENLRATRYADGTAIPGMTESQSAEWKADTSGAYLIDGDADWIKLAGYLYNGFTITNEAGIAPEGWEVPTQPQLTKLRSAGNLKAMNFKSSEPGTWAAGAEGNNKTGFSAVATGSYIAGNGVQAAATDAYFWSSTKYYDAFSRADNLATFRVTSTTTGNVVVSSSTLGGHNLQFGHTIRCVRK